MLPIVLLEMLTEIKSLYSCKAIDVKIYCVSKGRKDYAKDKMHLGLCKQNCYS